MANVIGAEQSLTGDQCNDGILAILHLHDGAMMLFVTGDFSMMELSQGTEWNFGTCRV